MKAAAQPRSQPRLYRVPNDQLDASGRAMTPLGIGPDSPAEESLQPLPLVRTKPAAETEVRPEPGTSFERAAEELLEEAPLTAWHEPAAPAPSMAASILAPPVAVPPPPPEREYDVDLSSLEPPPPTPLRARLARWAALLVLALIAGLGVMAIDRGLSRRAEAPAEPPVNATPAARTPTIGAAVPEPEADPHGLPPPNTSRAATAEARAQADWTDAPPPAPAGALGTVEDPGVEGAVTPPRLADGTTLSVNAIPDASVFVDGQPFGSTPRRLSVTPGKHEVVFVHPELGRRTVTVNVTAGGASVAAVEF